MGRFASGVTGSRGWNPAQKRNDPATQQPNYPATDAPFAGRRAESRDRRYPFYHAALGELENRLGHDAKARTHLQTAFALARNPMEQRFLQQRLEASARRSVGRQP